MRKKLKGEAFKELVIDRVSKAEMVKKYRELAKGKGDSDDEEEVDEALLSEKKATISKFKDPKVKDLTIKLAKERGLKVKELGGDKIEISGVTDLSELIVSDFESASPRDISFNPYRVMKSFLKQIYEIGIKEKQNIIK